jgi:hypothetical protein
MTIKYMVSVTGAQAPTKIHIEYGDAKFEAERLSKLTNNKDREIHIVKILATLKPVTTHNWVEE